MALLKHVGEILIYKSLISNVMDLENGTRILPHFNIIHNPINKVRSQCILSLSRLKVKPICITVDVV